MPNLIKIFLLTILLSSCSNDLIEMTKDEVITDKNRNGIEDAVEIYIEENYNKSPNMKSAILMLAKYVTELQIAGVKKTSIRSNVTASYQGISETYSCLKLLAGNELGTKIYTKVKDLILSTDDRKDFFKQTYERNLLGINNHPKKFAQCRFELDMFDKYFPKISQKPY